MLVMVVLVCPILLFSGCGNLGMKQPLKSLILENHTRMNGSDDQLDGENMEKKNRA